MSRQQFNSRNNIGKVLTFQKSGSTSSFDPNVAFISGSRRVSWKLYNGTGTTQVAGNSITYTGFTSDTSLRNIEMRGGDFTKINFFSLANDNLFGNLDVSELSSVNIFEVHTNPNLTGITHAPSTNNFTTYYAFSCNLKGNLDLSSLSGLGGDFRVLGNPNLTGITHTPSSQVFSVYQAYTCDLKGNHDLSMFPNLGGNLNLAYNPDLTGITLAPSSTNFTTYQFNDCDLSGNLDLSLLSGLGGTFTVYNNPNLTGITHAPSSNNFTSYYAQGCDLKGNLDLSMLKLGGIFTVATNSGLTSITHSVSTNVFTSYSVSSCGLIGNLDLRSFSGLGGSFTASNNPNLTGITHTASTSNFGSYVVNNCNLTGTLDLTLLSGFGQNSPIPESTFNSFNCRVDNNANLTNVLFPAVTTYFRNKQNITGNGAFVMNACNLDYVDFRPLSGATLTGGTSFGNPIMYLKDNSMTAADVNHILQDFLYNATNNPTGWSNINLDIGGTNANPDAISGGYDGLAAIATLIGAPYNWTITY